MCNGASRPCLNPALLRNKQTLLKTKAAIYNKNVDDDDDVGNNKKKILSPVQHC